MSLPKRNRRNAHVDGRHFHWVKGSRGDNGRGVVTVQDTTGTGAKLMVDPVGQIRDHEVVAAIQFALLNGWDPEVSGPPTWIGFQDHPDLGLQFALRTTKDAPYWTDHN